ncbi:1643_t:CDS:2 [Funneliformis mosseae]|uniref:1643_t:CDS:1 n=1 Tax=Funneliformis mosseae TaxID=27381 RepID=A0A9N8Z6S2_FUNMO|nr:1643_t:CDS:2 [Funneliformis mosseae]
MKNKNHNKKRNLTQKLTENDAKVNILGKQLEMDLNNTFSKTD